MHISRNDIEALKDSHSIETMLADAGVVIRGSRAQCPFCSSSTEKVDYPVSFTDRLFICHRCHEGGDIIKLHSLLRGLSFRDATRSLGLVEYGPPKKRYVTLSQYAMMRIKELDQEWQDGDDSIYYFLARKLNTIKALERSGSINENVARTRRAWAEAEALAAREKLDEQIEATQRDLKTWL